MDGMERNGVVLAQRRAVCLGKRMKQQDFGQLVLPALQRAPQWLRHDFASNDPAARERAEEALAAMVLAALGDGEKRADLA